MYVYDIVKCRYKFVKAMTQVRLKSSTFVNMGENFFLKRTSKKTICDKHMHHHCGL